MAEWNWSSSATRFAGIPISVKRRTSVRMPRRIERLARTGPSACSPATFGEVKYTCRTSTATEATSRHHWAASPPMFGGFAIVMKTFAPRSASRRRRISVFARYCAVVGVQGAGVCAPNSSFSAIHGVVHPLTVTAKSKRRSAFATIPAGSAGAVGVPTRLLKLRSKKTVAAPFARARAGSSVPDVNASVSPGFCGSGASMTREVDPHRLPVRDPALARGGVSREGETGEGDGEDGGDSRHAVVVAAEPADGVRREV